MTTTTRKPPKDTPETAALARITPLMEARAIQRFIYHRATKSKVSDSALASLARSWCLVQDCIRVMRGIPSPGQLRPDLDPQQMMKAMKRAKARNGVFDIAGAFEQPIEEAPSHSKALPQAKEQSAPAPDEIKKESLLTGQTVPTEQGGGGDGQDGAINEEPCP